MTISLNIPDAVAPRVVAAICVFYDYKDTLLGGAPNPETRPQFAKRMIVQHIRGLVEQHESNVAGNAAALSALSSAKSEIAIT